MDEKGIFLIIDELDFEGKIPEVNIVIVGIFEENGHAFGVNIGDTFKDVLNILGDDYTLNSPEENTMDELIGDNWSISYKSGDFLVTFVASERNGSINSIYIS